MRNLRIFSRVSRAFSRTILKYSTRSCWRSRPLSFCCMLPKKASRLRTFGIVLFLPGWNSLIWLRMSCRCVVQRCGGNQNDAHPFLAAATNLREHLVALRVLGAEAMRLVNKNGRELLEVTVQQGFQFAEGFAQEAAHAEVSEDIRPRAGIVFIQQVRRRDDKARLVAVFGTQRGDVGFSPADDL